VDRQHSCSRGTAKTRHSPPFPVSALIIIVLCDPLRPSALIPCILRHLMNSPCRIRRLTHRSSFGSLLPRVLRRRATSLCDVPFVGLADTNRTTTLADSKILSGPLQRPAAAGPFNSVATREPAVLERSRKLRRPLLFSRRLAALGRRAQTNRTYCLCRHQIVPRPPPPAAIHAVNLLELDEVLAAITRDIWHRTAPISL